MPSCLHEPYYTCAVAVLTTVRTARKRHRCARCSGWIEPGERYEEAALTPGSDVGNPHWWRERVHLSEYCGRAVRPDPLVFG